MASIILLTNGMPCLIDDEDFDGLSQFVWWENKSGYAVRSVTLEEKASGRRGSTQMHRHIMKAVKGQIIDHANMDKLDNRKENLRFCTHSQNHANETARASSAGRTSSFKGVAWSPEKACWRAAIVKDGRQRHLGYFHEERDAAHAYDYEAVQLFGEFARLNIPDVIVKPQPIVIRKNNSSGYRGVTCPKGCKRWRAVLQWRENGKHQQDRLGMFDTAEDAARAYNKAATQRFGNKARLNNVG